MKEEQGKTSYGDEKPESIWQIALSIGFLLALILGPHVIFIKLGPWFAIPFSILIVLVYYKIRGKGPGSAFVGALDIISFFNSAYVVGISCIVLIKQWLSWE